MLKRFFVVLACIVLTNVCFAECYVRVTYYNLSGKTALGTKTRHGICAVSRDLLHIFPLGSYIRLKGYGVYKVEDKTARHIKNTIDIWSRKPLPLGKRIHCEKHKTKHFKVSIYRNNELYLKPYDWNKQIVGFWDTSCD